MSSEKDKEKEKEKIAELERRLDVCDYKFEGGFPNEWAPVYKVRRGSSDVVDLVKILPLHVTETVNNFLEVDIPCRISHPHIIQNIDIISTLQCKFGAIGVVNTLGDYALNQVIFNLDTPAGMEKYLMCMYKIARGIDYLHENRILHLDIKPDNVVMFMGEPQIIDFGLSSIVCDENTRVHTNVSVGTPGFKAPEVYRKKDRFFSVKSDVWSFVMLMYSLAGKLVHDLPKMGDEVIFAQFSDRNKRTSIKFDIGQPQLRNFFNDAIQVDHEKRETISGILEMPLFKPYYDRIPIYGITKHDSGIQNKNTGDVDSYPDSLKKGIDIIYDIYLKEFGDVRALCFFYTLEILYRTIWVTPKDILAKYDKGGDLYHEFLTLCATCIVLGISSDLIVYIDVGEIAQLINNRADVEITVEHIEIMQDKIITLLHGILYISNLFDSCNNGGELIAAAGLIRQDPHNIHRNFIGFKQGLYTVYKDIQSQLLIYTNNHPKDKGIMDSRCLTVDMLFNVLL